jgi:hypothetical protein
MQIFSGLLYGLPMPVRPLNAMATRVRWMCVSLPCGRAAAPATGAALACLWRPDQSA